MQSPLTKSENVKFEEHIPVSLIKQKYKNELNIDVDRFFTTENVSIYRCLDTQYRYYYPFNIIGDDKLYEDLQDHKNYYSKWNWEHEKAFAYITVQNKVLEVGCGEGSFIEVLNNNNISASGLELNNKAVKVCLKKKLNVHNEILENHLKNFNNYYDVICSFQVLEHIKNPGDFINENIEAVKVGGRIIFGVPNNNPYVYKRDKYHTLNMPPHHMGLWSKEAFESIPKYFNVKVLDIIIDDYVDTRFYLKTHFQYNRLSFLSKMTEQVPLKFLNWIAKLRKWKGRNILAIYEKI